MSKEILIVLCLLISGCSGNNGPSCYEITDGSGRTGVFVGRDVFYKLRMDDTGNIELYRYPVRIECKINNLNK